MSSRKQLVNVCTVSVMKSSHAIHTELLLSVANNVGGPVHRVGREGELN